MASDSDTPTHDGSPTTLWLFIQALDDWVYRQDGQWRFLINEGAVVIKGRFRVQNPTHFRLIKAGLMRQADGTAYTARNPAPCTVADYDAAAHHNLVPAPLLDANGAVVADYTHVLTDEEKTECSVEPGTIRIVNLAMGKAILECITSNACRKEREKSTSGLGTLCLAQIAAEAQTNMDPELACTLVQELNDWLDAGFSGATLVSFMEWRDAAESANNAIPEALGKLTTTLLAGRYAIATSSLNSEIKTELKHAMRSSSASGNLDLTVAAIKETLASAEAAAKDMARRKKAAGHGGRALMGQAHSADAKDQATIDVTSALTAAANRFSDLCASCQPASSAAGHAFLAGNDPSKTRPPFDPSTLTAEQQAKRPKLDAQGNKYWHSAMGPCRHCKKPGHLNKDCSSLKVNGGTIVPGPATKKGKAKLAAAGEQSDDEDGDEEVAMALFAGASKQFQLEGIMNPDALLSELKIQEEAQVNAKTTGRAAMARGSTPAAQELQSDDEEDDDVEDASSSTGDDEQCSNCQGDEKKVTLSCGKNCATYKALGARVNGSLVEGMCQSCGSLTSHKCVDCHGEWYCSEKCQTYDAVGHHHRTDGGCGKDDSIPILANDSSAAVTHATNTLAIVDNSSTEAASAPTPMSTEAAVVPTSMPTCTDVADPSFQVVVGSPLGDNGIYFGTSATVNERRRANSHEMLETGLNSVWDEHLMRHPSVCVRDLGMATEHCSLLGDAGTWHMLQSAARPSPSPTARRASKRLASRPKCT